MRNMEDYIFCGNCGAKVDASLNFCPGCGSKIIKTQENDGQNTEFATQEADESIVVNNENSEATEIKELTEATEETQNTEEPRKNSFSVLKEAVPSDESTESSKKSSKKPVIITVAVLLIVSVLGVGVFGVLSKLTGNKTENAPFVYYADGELYAYKDINKKAEPFLISDDYPNRSTASFLLSEDYKYIVYCENEQTDDGETTYDLYVKKMFDKKSHGVLLTKGISRLQKVVGSIDGIYYLKNDDIYVTDIKGDNRKLASDSILEAFSDDNGKMLVTSKTDYNDYVDEDEGDTSGYSVSIIDLKTEKTNTLTKKATSFDYNSSLSTVSFIENDDLYLAGSDKKNQKISGNSQGKVSEYYVKGDKVYYLTQPDKFYHLEDFVKDDCKQSDLEAEYPVWDDYCPHWSDYCPDYEDFKTERYSNLYGYEYSTDYDAYDMAYEEAKEKFDEDTEKANEDYEKAEELYEEALDRVDLREELEGYEDKYGYGEYSLYCYDGKSTLIADSVYSVNDIDSNNEDASETLILKTYGKPLKEIKKINIKDITSADDVISYLNNDIYGNLDIKTVSDKKATDFNNDKDTLQFCYYNSNTKEYFVKKEKNEDDNFYELYSVPAGSGFAKGKLLCDECFGFSFVNGKFGYYTDGDRKNRTATFNFDGKEIIDTSGYILTNKKDNSCFYYSTDYNEKTGLSTVWKYSKGKTEKIADDVLFTVDGFAVIDGKYIYITEYDTDDGCGELVCRDSDKGYTLTEDVSSLYNTNTEKNLIYADEVFYTHL